tara:strand:+ start:135 stop:299 length:165 start_codon:yes stop_codon:yes gene_type:complete
VDSDYMPEEIQEIEDLQKINVAAEEPRQPLKSFYDWLENITSKEKGKSFFDWLN